MKRALRSWPLLMISCLFLGTGAWLTYEIIEAGQLEDEARDDRLAASLDNDGDEQGSTSEHLDRSTVSNGPSTPMKSTKPEEANGDGPKLETRSVQMEPTDTVDPPNVQRAPEQVPEQIKVIRLDDSIGRRRKRFSAGKLRVDRSGGRIELPSAKNVVIGTPLNWIIESEQKERDIEAFHLEAPLHHRNVEGFLMDKMEVSNAQYSQYLKDFHGPLDVARRQGAPVAHVSLQGIKGTTVRRWAATLLDPTTYPDHIDIDRFAQQIARSTPGIFNAPPTPIADTPDSARDSNWLPILDNGLPPEGTVRVYQRAPPAAWPSLDPSRLQTEHPVRGVSFHEALAYADWAGKHIPNEFEWEYAARGSRGRSLPWGGVRTDWIKRVHWEGEETPNVITVPIHNLANGATPEGVRNLLGNVSEWTSSLLSPYPNAESYPPGDLRSDAQLRVVRGGSVVDASRLLVRSACRGWWRPLRKLRPPQEMNGAPIARRRLPWTGFRCASYRKLQGRSHTRNMASWASSAVFPNWRIPESRVNTKRYSGVFWRDHAEAGQAVQAGVFVSRGAQWIAATSLNYVSYRAEDFVVQLPGDETSRTGLGERSGRGGLPFGILSTSFPIVRLYKSRDGFPKGSQDAFKDPERRVRATAPAGCYVLMLHHGAWALRGTGSNAIYYFDRKRVSATSLGLTWSGKSVDWTQPPPSTVQMSRFAGSSDSHYTIQFVVPIRPSKDNKGAGKLSVKLNVRLDRTYMKRLRLEKLEPEHEQGVK